MQEFIKLSSYGKDLADLLNDLEKFGERAKPHLKKSADASANLILKEARRRVPVKTRELKKKLRVNKANIKSRKLEVVANVGFPKSVAYAVPLELGHGLKRGGRLVGFVTERPFMRTAADFKRREVRAMLIEGINDALNELRGK